MTPPRRALLITKNDFRPQRDGGSKRVAAVVAGLESAGYRVDWVAARPFASSISKVDGRPTWAELRTMLRIMVAAVRTLSLSVLKWQSYRALRQVAHLAVRTSYDVVDVEYSQLAPYALATRNGVKCTDMHNIEAELLQNFAASSANPVESALGRYEAWRMRILEKSLPRRFDVVATVSEHDAEWLGDEGTVAQRDVVVAPNGISPEFFGVTGAPSRDVVFIGHLGWRPNIDAAEWLATAVWPLVQTSSNGLRLRLVGQRPDARVMRLANETITVHPDVPSVLPFLKDACVATAPLLSAGGTRIKILEALAAGAPVVATSLGALGLELLVGPHLVIADSPQEFATALERMSQTVADRSSVRDLVAAFAWEQSISPYIDAVGTQVGDRARP